MCTVLLLPGVNPIAVDIYIISYHIYFPAGLNHQFLSSASGMTGVNYYGDSSSDLCAPSSSNTTEMSRLASDMTVMSPPTGEASFVLYAL